MSGEGKNVEIKSFGGGHINLFVEGIAESPTYETTNINVQPVSNFAAFTDSPNNNNLQPKLKIISTGLLAALNLNLKAQHDGHFANCEWVYCCDQFKHMTLEMSNDGYNFEEINRLQDDRTDQDSKVYKYRHHNMANYPKLYFRVAIKNFDGSVEYSNLEVVDFDAKDNYSVLYPSPVKIGEEVTFSSDMNQYRYLKVYDMFGQEVMEIFPEQGEREVTIPTTNLARGMYNLSSDIGRAGSFVIQ